MRRSELFWLEAAHRGVHTRGLITFRKKLDSMDLELRLLTLAQKRRSGKITVGRRMPNGILAQFQEHTDIPLSTKTGNNKGLGCCKVKSGHWLVCVFNLL
jgi:hypothetical protein